MENQNRKEDHISNAKNNLEWGNHNPKLTADNFIDRKRGAEATVTDESLASSNAEKQLLEKESEISKR